MPTDDLRTTFPETEPSQIKRLTGVGLKAFFKITQAWGLTSEQEMILLGSPHSSNFSAWKINPSAVDLDQDTLQRISYILGIYKALQTLLPTPIAADEWMKKANTEALFQGRSALDYLLSGDVSNLCTLRQYLDAMIGD